MALLTWAPRVLGGSGDTSRLPSPRDTGGNSNPGTLEAGLSPGTDQRGSPITDEGRGRLPFSLGWMPPSPKLSMYSGPKHTEEEPFHTHNLHSPARKASPLFFTYCIFTHTKFKQIFPTLSLPQRPSQNWVFLPRYLLLTF